MKTEELVKQILADKRYSHIPQSMIEFCVEFSDSNPDFIRERLEPRYFQSLKVHVTLQNLGAWALVL